MTRFPNLLAALSGEIAELSGRLGRRVEPDKLGVLDRAPFMALQPAGRPVSPNGGCRVLQTADGDWMALNLARPEDLELLPAWLEDEAPADDPWPWIEGLAQRRATTDLLARAILLGLPAAQVGEARPFESGSPGQRFASPAPRRGGPLKVVDLSALWAGPLCGAVFAEMGAQVVRIETRRRDPTQDTTPEFFRRLNNAKAVLALDLENPADLDELRRQIAAADLLITSARPRAFAALGLSPEAIFTGHDGLVWVAITAHGWTGEAASRVGFGDDTAAAGGLMARDRSGAPAFLGDALADPVTGLMAAAAALRAMEDGGGLLLDVAMARCAATAALSLAHRSAA